MKALKEKYNRFVYPHIIWVYASFGLSLLAWGAVWFFKPGWGIRIPLIVFTVYTGIIVAYSLPQIVGEVMTLLNGNKYISMFLNDINVRMFATLYMNLCITSLYAAMNVINGMVHDSNWQIAIALYYMVLTLVRFYLLSYVSKYDTVKNRMNAGEVELSDFKKYQMTGWLLLLIIIPLAWITLQMVEENQSYNYSGFMMYVMTAFNIYVWGMVIYGQMMYGKIDNPILTSTRAIALACALVSTLALLTSFLGNIGYDHEVFTKEALISLLGTGSCLIIFCVGIHMIIRAHSILSLNVMPRRFREKVTISQRRATRKADLARDKAAYAQMIQNNWQNGSPVNPKVVTKGNRPMIHSQDLGEELQKELANG